MNFKSISEIEKNYDLIGCGATAQIYKYDILTALKIFYLNLSAFDEDRFNILSRIKTDYFAFPTENIYIKNRLKGHTMSLKTGIPFANLSDNILIDNLLDALKKLERDIFILSENNIRILDLHDENIMYDSNKNVISVIDTSEYGYLYKDKETLRIYNILSIAYIILNYLSLNYETKNILTIDDIINEIENKIYNLEEFYKTDINKVEDIKKLKKIIK